MRYVRCNSGLLLVTCSAGSSADLSATVPISSITFDGRIQPTEGDAPVMNFRSAARSADPNLLKVGPGGPAGNHFKLSEVCRRNGGAFRRLRGEIHMGWWDDKLQDAIAAVTRRIGRKARAGRLGVRAFSKRL